MSDFYKTVLFTIGTLGTYALVYYGYLWLKDSMGSDNFYDLLHKVVGVSILVTILGMAFGTLIQAVGNFL